MFICRRFRTVPALANLQELLLQILTSFVALGTRSEGNSQKKEQYDDTEASFINYDITPADFYAFPQMKSTLKGRSFCNVTDVIKNATKELKRLSQNSFHEYFQHRYST
jgi:hypothetical protein